MSADHAGLFESPGSPSLTDAAAKGKKAPAAGPRREKLFNYDHAAVQWLLPFEPSAFTDKDAVVVYKACAKGTRGAKFNTLLAADPDQIWRVGAGVSQTAQGLLAAIAELENPDLAKIIQPQVLSKVLEEARGLKPHLEALYFGKGGEGQEQDASISALKKRKIEGENAKPPASATAITEAAKKLHDWASKPSSHLRAMLAYLAGNGMFWAGHCVETVLRGAVLGKPLGEQALVDAAMARRGAAQDPHGAEHANNKDTHGLIE
jgi:predicted NBD/HSP70 family sugar kinase